MKSGVPGRSRAPKIRLHTVSTSVTDVQSPDEQEFSRQTSRRLSVDATPSWKRAMSLAPPRTLSEMFSDEGDRRNYLTVSAADLIVDFTRQQVDGEVVQALVAAAHECGVRVALDQMVAGAPINVTEQRAVGHMALRMPRGATYDVGGVNVVPMVHETLSRMSQFARGVRTGSLTGATGQRFSAVLNIGIGGSDLGPRMVHEALRHLGHETMVCRFAANVDPDDLATQLRDLDPERTLVVVSSKTFTTTETLLNARVATDWIRSNLGDGAVRGHVVAVSSDERAVRASGLGAEIVFPLWDWVGGRYSLGSAVGLSVMLALGPETFLELLSGMRDLDEHMLNANLEHNAPLVMALIGVWNHAVLGHATRAVIPYSFGLSRLPAYLQQLMMESNGKSVRVDGSPVGLSTSPVVWGDVGTNAQHAFMQLLHQGTATVPVDFIGFAQPQSESTSSARSSQRTLFLNMVAQAQTLAFGRSSAMQVGESAPHRIFPGNRPSTVIVAPRLEPRILGQIIALYEQAVFFEGVLLGINSFDQWGVELGKEMASTLVSAAHVDSTELSPSDRAGRMLVDWFDAHVDPKTA